MAQKETAGGNGAAKIPFFPGIGEFAQKQAQGLTQFQSELMEEVQQVNHHWLERIQSEAALASEFTGKLQAARSLPETATVYQEWIKRRMELASEDSKYAMTEGQKLMQAGTRLFSNGWSAAPKAGST